MTRLLHLTVLALAAAALAAGPASAQSDAKDRALAYGAVVKRESDAGFAEFAKLETDSATQAAVCTHLAAGIRHFITANENANAMIRVIEDARMWNSYDEAHAVGVNMSTMANRAIDEYNRQCAGWVGPGSPDS